MKNCISAIGQDSHRFVEDNNGKNKTLIMGGIKIPDHRALDGNSDADVVFHAITNAISGITCINVLGDIADKMCKEGITDSKEYLIYALNTLKEAQILHVSVSIECKTPKLSPFIPEMRKKISYVMGIKENQVGITATTGEGLTDFGRGLGVFATCIITVRQSDINE